MSTLYRDPAIRSLPRWGAISLATMGVLLGVRAYLAAAQQPDAAAESARMLNVLALAATIWIPVSIHAVIAGTTARCSRLELTLPLSPRRLWVGHLAAVTIASTAVLVLCVTLLSAQTSGFRGFLREDAFLREPNVAGMLPLLIASLWLSCAVLQTYKPSLRKFRFDRRYAFFAALTVIGGLVPAVVLSGWPAAGALIPLALAVAVARHTYRSLPTSYRHAPAAAEPAEGQDKAAAAAVPALDDRPASRNRLLMRTIWSTIWGWKAVLWLPIVMIFGALLAGVTSWFADYPDERFANTAISWYMLLTILPAVVKKFHTLDALPVSRRSLFACVVLPALVSVVVGYGAAELIKAFKNDHVEHIHMREIDNHFYVTVPPEYCEIALRDSLPQNRSPWGEAHDPWRAGLLEGGKIGIYSPYSTPPGSSMEFVAWQISRAVEAVYGDSIPPEEIESRYLDIDADGRVVPKNGALGIRSDHPYLTTRGEGRLFPVLMLIVFVPFLLLLCVYLSAFRPGVPRSRAVWIAVLLLVGTISIHVAGFVGAVYKLYALWVHTAFVKIVIRHVDAAAPGGSTTLWLACGLAVLIAYRFAEKRFGRIEFPPTPRRPID